MIKNRHYIDERTFVEEPLLQQLEGLGWEVLRLKSPSEGVQYAEESWRENFSQVIIRRRLADALRTINSWLEEDQVERAIRELTTYTGGNLLENNRDILKKLLEFEISLENRKTGINSSIRYIDFDHIGNNNFIAVSQFKVRIIGTENHIYPDITLFLNGLPVAVIECKSPKVKDPMGEAIEQLLRYSEQRSETIHEGNRELFYFNQIVIATCRDTAKFGTITTHVEKHFYRWTDPYPLTVNDIREIDVFCLRIIQENVFHIPVKHRIPRSVFELHLFDDPVKKLVNGHFFRSLSVDLGKGLEIKGFVSKVLVVEVLCFFQRFGKLLVLSFSAVRCSFK